MIYICNQTIFSTFAFLYRLLLSICMKLKKIVVTLLKSLLVLVAIAFAYFVYAVIWIYRFNTDQKRAVENVDPDFYQTSQLIRDPNGYFGIVATINNQCADTF